MAPRRKMTRALVRTMVAGAAVVAISLTGAVSAIAEAPPSATISGLVTKTSGGGVVDGFVSASDANGIAVQAPIGPDGRYELAVAPGSYVVKFTSNDSRVLPEYWQDARLEQDATPVAVQDSEALVLDATLDSATAIRGTVRAEGVPLADAILEAWVGGELAGMAYADQSGVYELILPAGSYVLRARGKTYNPIYATQYYFSANTASEATPLPLGADADLTGIDFDLARGGDIRGTITGADAPLPAEGAVVTAYLWRNGWQPVASVTTSDAYGFGYVEPPFATEGGPLPAGSYAIGVEAEGFCPQFFGGASEADDATAFALASGEVVAGIDMVLSTVCPEPQPDPTLTVSVGTARAGDTVSVSGDGFAPGQEVVFELYSHPVYIDTLTADADGRISGTLRIPATTVPGVHTLAALVAGRIRASSSLEVTAAVDPGNGGPGGDTGATGGVSSPPITGSVTALASTGAEIPGTILLAGLILSGAGALLLRRRESAL